MIILLPKRTSQVQVAIKMIMIKNNRLRHTNIRITHIIILLTKIMSQVQVTEKMILMKNQDVNMENH